MLYDPATGYTLKGRHHRHEAGQLDWAAALWACCLDQPATAVPPAATAWVPVSAPSLDAVSLQQR
jgi:hypothetical protein